MSVLNKTRNNLKLSEKKEPKKARKPTSSSTEGQESEDMQEERSRALSVNSLKASSPQPESWVEPHSGKDTQNGEQPKIYQQRDPATMTQLEKELAVRRYGVKTQYENRRLYTYLEDDWNRTISGTFKWVDNYGVEDIAQFEYRKKKDGTKFQAFYDVVTGKIVKGTYEEFSWESSEEGEDEI